MSDLTPIQMQMLHLIANDGTRATGSTNRSALALARTGLVEVVEDTGLTIVWRISSKGFATINGQGGSPVSLSSVKPNWAAKAAGITLSEGVLISEAKDVVIKELCARIATLEREAAERATVGDDLVLAGARAGYSARDPFMHLLPTWDGALPKVQQLWLTIARAVLAAVAGPIRQAERERIAKWHDEKWAWFAKAATSSTIGPFQKELYVSIAQHHAESAAAIRSMGDLTSESDDGE